MSNNAAELTSVYRRDGGRLLATLIRQFRDFDLCEDVLAEAYLRAAKAWESTGVPDNPAAWILTTARRVALDKLRMRSRHLRPDLQQAIRDIEEGRQSEIINDSDIPDERLRLMFTCCHPSIARDAQISLTLKTLGGLTVEEIARAFLIKPAALAKRLSRAKTKIRVAGIRYSVPEKPDLPDRLPQVLEVLYLIYNESYAATDGVSLTRADLGEEAIRLARLLHSLLPLPETQGLLALMLLHDARRAARADTSGNLVPLELQDRSRWDRAKAEEGKNLLLNALGQRRPGSYQIQAAISAVHLEADTWEETDWPQIAGLYRALEAFEPTDVVRVNRAVAMAHGGELEEALRLLDSLGEEMEGYYPYYVARADVDRKLENLDAARRNLEIAARLSGNSAEQRFLRNRIENL